MSSKGKTTFRSLRAALQDCFIQQRTGTLTCNLGDRSEVLFLLSGQLYPSGTNPCRDRLEGILTGTPPGGEDPRFDPRAYLNRELSGIVRKLTSTFSAWPVEEVRLREVLEDVPDNIVGPVPTAELLMDLTTHETASGDLLTRLGGEEVTYQTFNDERARRRVPYLRVDELRLLDRLEKRATLGQLLEETGNDSDVIRPLARLIAVGLVEADGETVRPMPSEPEDVLAEMPERIAADLEAHPLDLDPRLHRAQVETMLASYGRLSYYELLGVGGNTPPEEIHGAFMGLARLAHPLHAASLGLESSQEQLERLLLRLTEAYLALSTEEEPEEDGEAGDERQRAGQLDIGDESPERRAEREEVAHQSYMAALDCIEVDDYFYAIQLLERATVSDPRPEYYSLLGLCQRKNPKWLHMAVDSFERASSMSPEDEALAQQLSDVKKEYQEYLDSLEPASELERRAGEPTKARESSEVAEEAGLRQTESPGQLDSPEESEEPVETEETSRLQRLVSKLWPS